MAEYISSFITGFEPVVSGLIPVALHGARVTEMFDGLARYHYDGAPPDVASLPFFNNTFAVIRYFSGGGLSFEGMAARVTGAAGTRFRTAGAAPPGARFRVRFSRENQFAKVSKSVIEATERAVVKNRGLILDRLNPDTEFWYVIRREGFGFFGQLLKKRVSTEKNLHRGELRPELAYLLCHHCFGAVGHVGRTDANGSRIIDGGRRVGVVCDPFAGYGAIPAQIIRHFTYAKLYVNDVDADLVAAMKAASPRAPENIVAADNGRAPAGGGSRIVLTCRDAADLAHIPDGSVDYVVTDPPWGFASDIGDLPGFYRGVLMEFRRILAPGGRMALLAGQPGYMEDAAARAGLTRLSRLDVLVNGKKAAVLKYAHSAGNIV